MVESRTADADLVSKCRNCTRFLFATVVRCPYCGARARALPETQPAAIPVEAPAPAPAGRSRTTETASIIAAKPRNLAPRQPFLGLSKPVLAVIVFVVVLITALWASEFTRNRDGKRRQTIVADTEWQILEVPKGARIVANGAFRLRSGSDLYTVPLHVGVAVPTPQAGETLEVRAVIGTVTLNIIY